MSREKKDWEGMPEFIQEDIPIYGSIKVSCKTEEDWKLLAKALKQPLTELTKSVWFPEGEKHPHSGKRYVEE